MNRVILMGRLVRDPEIRYSQGENSLAIARYTRGGPPGPEESGRQSAHGGFHPLCSFRAESGIRGEVYASGHEDADLRKYPDGKLPE